ncbi:hypothetical protein Psi02_48110 [Planotetraspora silvatica]|uniref:Uncharacterized protein n=1 Tax=Planotetraspora silvatica TaxID=234614 RepID=A0A8J3URA9_9ACTN|nr:hypothetical protein Psi02_48110 [Planotetraspora silvatica]
MPGETALLDHLAEPAPDAGCGPAPPPDPPPVRAVGDAGRSDDGSTLRLLLVAEGNQGRLRVAPDVPCILLDEA